MCDFDLFALADIADILGDIQGQLDTINASIVNASKPNCWDKAGIIANIVGSVFTAIGVCISLYVSYRNYKENNWKNWVEIKDVVPQIDYETNAAGTKQRYLKLLLITERKHHSFPIKFERAVLYINGVPMLFNAPQESSHTYSWFTLAWWSNSKGHNIYERMSLEDFIETDLKKEKNINAGDILLDTNIGRYQKDLTKKQIKVFKDFFKKIKEIKNEK